MATIYKRKNTWFARWTGPDGRSVSHTTKVKVMPLVKPKGMTTAQCAKQQQILARERAEILESVAKGITPVSKGKEAVEAVAARYGLAPAVPSTEKYLLNFPPQAAPKTEQQRQQEYCCFLEWLGPQKAKLPLNRITPEDISGYFLWLLLHKKLQTKTVQRRRQNLSCAFNRAINADHCITVNPVRAVNLRQLMKVHGIKEVKTRRKSFTPAEMATIITRASQPYRDLAAVAFFAGGLRLGDTCLLRWDTIDFEQNKLSIVEEKTENPHQVPLVRELREILQARKAQQQGNEVYVFPDMACQYKRAAGVISTAFMAELRALGIKTHAELTTPLKGRRRRVPIKCFHSIRHTVVSFARSCKKFTADMVRETVGHDSEEIEREYFSAEEESKRAVLEAVAAYITPATDSRAAV